MPIWSHITAVLDIVGYVSTVVVGLATLSGIYLCFTGFLPVLIRLGDGLTQRKIALFAKAGMADSLHALLVDGQLFKAKNIIRITDDGDLGRAEEATVFLVYWPDWQDQLGRIIDRKKDTTALVIYAPQGGGPLPAEAIELLEKERNVVLANLRGRLMNDVVVSLITSAYAKR